ncbi:MAG: putative toxin-antitoxin system toxin component, PIN family [Chloroflexota bacterium]|nr:putative toxin-antitoxin system toxin component, PIN family [Anaerolineae bacterium]
MRIVLDANVFVSGFISERGSPAKILAYWKEEKFDVVVSLAILQELERVLHYPRLQERYSLPENDIQRFLRLLRRQAIEVEPSEKLSVITRDPTDDRYLECALAGEATVIVSGDRHLLDLGEYRGVQILSPAGFIAFLKTVLPRLV